MVRRRAHRSEIPPPTAVGFALHIEQYIEACWVDRTVMRENGVYILRGYFHTPEGEEVMVHVPDSAIFCTAHSGCTRSRALGTHEPQGLL